jgi:DNA-binding NarL/FixJ family response regulator
LCLLALGLTTKDIAQTSSISVCAVEAHLRSVVIAKLGMRSRTEAALWAERPGRRTGDFAYRKPGGHAEVSVARGR